MDLNIFDMVHYIAVNVYWCSDGLIFFDQPEPIQLSTWVVLSQPYKCLITSLQDVQTPHLESDWTINQLSYSAGSFLFFIFTT